MNENKQNPSKNQVTFWGNKKLHNEKKEPCRPKNNNNKKNPLVTLYFKGCA